MSLLVEGIEDTLDATDKLLEWLTRETEMFADEKFVDKLSLLRNEHKRTLRLIEQLYYDQVKI